MTETVMDGNLFSQNFFTAKDVSHVLNLLTHTVPPVPQGSAAPMLIKSYN